MEYDLNTNTYLMRQAEFEPLLDGWEKSQELRPGKYAGSDYGFEIPGATSDTPHVSFLIHPEWFL